MVVLDASVIIKWFKPDEKSLRASFYLEQHEKGQEIIFAPVLLRYEVINALRYSKKLNEADLEKVIFLLGKANLTYISPDDTLLLMALKISFESEISIYDASYIALAKHLNCPLITADKYLYQKTKNIVKVVLL